MKTILRLAEFIDFKGLSLNKFDEKINASNGYIGKQIKKKASIGSDILENILKIFPEINPIWLLTGKGEMMIKNEEAEVKNKFILHTDNDISKQRIPLYNIEASAGLVQLFENFEGTETEDFISIPHLSKCDGSIYVTGDSMYPLVKSGDIVAYKQIHNIQHNIFWGEMYLISLEMDGDHYTTIKYIQKSEKGEEFVKLVSQNQHHQPKDVLINGIKALAIVKATIRLSAMY